MLVSPPPERILIADDEPTARRWLRDLLARESGLSLVAECADGETAAAEIERLRPDLVFLDVEMPGMTGLEVVRRIGVERMPPTVFVTAHDRYAAEAFEVDGIDYLLKPFGAERFARTLAKARSWAARVDSVERPQRLQAALDAFAAPPALAAPVSRLLVRTGEAQQFVRVADIVYIEADRNYVRLRTPGGWHVLRESMTGILGRLDPQVFRRIHRSHIVNVEHVHKLLPWFGGDRLVIMNDGSRLTLSRNHRDALDGA
jgi:two-component system LytT family response regulator